jgi:putative copper resistance protein D
VYGAGLYYANVTVHVLAALLWLGGMFFLGVVGAPVLRKVEPPALRAELFRLLGERFRTVGWGAIGVLIVTGLLNLHYRGLLSTTLLDAAFWGSAYGRALAWKLSSVLAMIGVSALHDFSFGPAAGRVPPGTPEAVILRRRAALLARVNALLGVVVVIAAVRLARGG